MTSHVPDANHKARVLSQIEDEERVLNELAEQIQSIALAASVALSQVAHARRTIRHLRDRVNEGDRG